MLETTVSRDALTGKRARALGDAAHAEKPQADADGMVEVRYRCSRCNMTHVDKVPADWMRGAVRVAFANEWMGDKLVCRRCRQHKSAR
jgi:hypothetical protein